MNVFTSMRVFLPSECQWVFQWVIGSAMPTLLGSEPLRRTQIFLCDGDTKIYRSYDHNKPKVMPNSKQVICGFHLVNKGLERLKPKLLGWDTGEVNGQLFTFKQWLFSWMVVGKTESEDIFRESYKLLREWLQ